MPPCPEVVLAVLGHSEVPADPEGELGLGGRRETEAVDVAGLDGLGVILPTDQKTGELTLQQGVDDPGVKEFQDPAKLGVKISYAWMYPITCLLTLGCGILGGRLSGGRKSEA